MYYIDTERKKGRKGKPDGLDEDLAKKKQKKTKKKPRGRGAGMRQEDGLEEGGAIPLATLGLVYVSFFLLFPP